MSNMTNEKKRKRLFCPQSMKSWTVSTIFYGASVRYVVSESNTQTFEKLKTFAVKTDLF